MDTYLLNHYSENTTEYFFVVSGIEKENFEIKNSSVQTEFFVVYTRAWTDEKIKESPKYEKVISYIKENYLENIEKAYDIWIMESNGYDSWHFRVRICKKNPKKFSIPEKISAAVKILTQIFIREVQVSLVSESNNKELITDFSEKLNFFISKIQKNIEKFEAGSIEVKCFKISLKAYKEILSDLKQKFSFYFDDTEISSQKKVVWNGNPDLFFILFSALIENNFIKSENNKAKLSEISPILRNLFKVLVKQKAKNEYSPDSFEQLLKKTNDKFSKDGVYYEYRNQLIKLLKDLSEYPQANK